MPTWYSICSRVTGSVLSWPCTTMPRESPTSRISTPACSLSLAKLASYDVSITIFSPLSCSLRKCPSVCRKPGALLLVDQLIRRQRKELDVLVVGGDVLEQLRGLVELAFGSGVLDLHEFFVEKLPKEL